MTAPALRQREYRHVFRRMEHDREYRSRLGSSGRLNALQYSQLYATGEHLDALGDSLQPPMQRRIVEDVAL